MATKPTAKKTLPPWLKKSDGKDKEVMPLAAKKPMAMPMKPKGMPMKKGKKC